jgi:hypothetical protein
MLERPMMSRYACLLMCALFAAGLAGCKATDVAAVYGTYVADYPVASETLTLRPDGAFTQTVTMHASGKRVVSNGRWRFDAPTAFVIFPSGYIEVLDALKRARPDFGEPLSGVVDMPVVICLGRLYIGTAQFVLYHKREPQNAASAFICRQVL